MKALTLVICLVLAGCGTEAPHDGTGGEGGTAGAPSVGGSSGEGGAGGAEACELVKFVQTTAPQAWCVTLAGPSFFRETPRVAPGTCASRDWTFLPEGETVVLSHPAAKTNVFHSGAATVSDCSELAAGGAHQ